MIQTNIQSNSLKLLTNAVSLLLIVGAVLCVYTPNNIVLKNWASYAAQITMGYWALGLLFLALRQPRLTMYSFVCCAFLCIYLKSATNPALQLPTKTGEPSFKVAQFNLSAHSGDYSSFLNILRKEKANIVSIQEVTPDWANVLEDSLRIMYPHQCSYQTTNQTTQLYSLKVLSRVPFSVCDTLFCDNVPSLILSFKNTVKQKPVYIISTYIEPPLFTSAYKRLQKQLDTIAFKIKTINAPVITVGDYNVAASTNEVQLFRQMANLNDSRRGYRPSRADGHFSLLDVPTDHIFYTNHFNCIDFQTISGVESERLGILGVYQFVQDSLIVNR
jgi:endonuclease/exonuclease/phosphatase (EEP) superfamily protein YafD